MTKKDYIIAGLLTLVAALLIFINLGSVKTPETFWAAREGDKLLIELSSKTQLSDASVYYGFPSEVPASGCVVSIELYDAGWTPSFKKDSVTDEEDAFMWQSTFGDSAMAFDTRYIAVVIERGAPAINEIVFLDAHGKAVDISEAQISISAGNAVNYLNAFDEQETFQGARSHMLEINAQERSFVRAAYEKINGEKTKVSSPLGIAFISLGIRIFGMNPLGWRFMSALFGLFTVPLLYLFGKKLFNSPCFGAIFAGLALINGIFLAVFRLAAPFAVALFLLALAFYFLLCFYKINVRKGEEAYKRSVLYLCLAGAACAAAVAAERAAVFSALALAGVFAAAFLRDREHFKEGKRAIFSLAAAGVSALAALLTFIFTPAALKTATNGLLNASAPLLFEGSSEKLYYKIHLFGNTAVYWFGLFSFVFALMFTVLAFLRKDNDGEAKKKLRGLYFIFIGLLSSLLGLLAGGFYAVPLFSGALTVFTLREFVLSSDAEFAGRLKLTKGKIFAGVILLFFIMNFILILPVVAGYPVSQSAAGLFTWLNGALG